MSQIRVDRIRALAVGEAPVIDYKKADGSISDLATEFLALSDEATGIVATAEEQAAIATTKAGEVAVAAAVLLNYRSLLWQPTLQWDLDDAALFDVTLTGNTTLALPEHLRPGAFAMFVRQDAAGMRTMSFAPGIKAALGVLPVLSSLPHAIDILSFISDGTSLYVSINPSQM